MKSNQKNRAQFEQFPISRVSNTSATTALAISKKLLEIKRISGAGEMTELNTALFRHLK